MDTSLHRQPPNKSLLWGPPAAEIYFGLNVDMWVCAQTTTKQVTTLSTNSSRILVWVGSHLGCLRCYTWVGDVFFRYGGAIRAAAIQVSGVFLWGCSHSDGDSLHGSQLNRQLVFAVTVDSHWVGGTTECWVVAWRYQSIGCGRSSPRVRADIVLLALTALQSLEEPGDFVNQLIVVLDGNDPELGAEETVDDCVRAAVQDQ